MLHIFYGEDDYSIRQALEEIRASIGDATAIMTNSTVLDGAKATPDELRAACETMPFLAEKRLVVVEGLLEKYEPRKNNGRKKAAKKKDGEPEEWRAVADGIKGLPEFTELVITGGKAGKTNPLLKALAGTGEIRQFPLMNASNIGGWINRRVAEGGGNITPTAAGLLGRFVGNDLWTLSNEVDKLIQYAAGRPITEEDVNRLVSSTREAGVFNLVDAIVEGRAGPAQDMYRQMLLDGVAPAYLMVMIARQLRILFLVKEMRGRKKGREDIRAALGNASDFVLNKAAAQAGKYSLERLRDIYHRLLETDIAIKTGRYDEELALSIFITETGPGSGRKA